MEQESLSSWNELDEYLQTFRKLLENLRDGLKIFPRLLKNILK